MTTGSCPCAEQVAQLACLLRPTLGVAKGTRVAEALILRFGTFSDALMAAPARLQEVEGIGPATAAHLGNVSAAAKTLAQRRIISGLPVLHAWSDLVDYCHVHMAFETVEQVRVIFLDKKNRLIVDEVQQTGTIDYAPVYPRQVIRRALELSASALILVHNHPSGDPMPSSADVHMTRDICAAAKPMGIVVHDHIIVGKFGHASLKALGLLDL